MFLFYMVKLSPRDIQRPAQEQYDFFERGNWS